MLSLFKSRTFLTVLGFVLLGLFIWYGGPYFAFADYHPLGSVLARVVATAIVIGLWATSLVVQRLRANRASDNLMAAVAKQPDAGKEQSTAEAQQLRDRFEEAVATLKQKRRSGHSLYDLPWYVIIGAPGSGKTTALVNSGLKFPVEQRTGKGALRGVGGTRNCDWWFTDEAVFLDTAGRYTTQDSDAAADSAGWAEFLALLRKYRRRRPVNGVILAISGQDLLTQGQAGREAHVAAARRRLDELNRELRIQLPVYLLVTKCDLVAGFSEYFDDLPLDGRAQVWGTTFSYEQTRTGQSAQVFPAEFDELIARLNARLFSRLEEDRDAQRRTRIFAFPQQMSGLRDGLAQLVTDVFASTRFDRQILLRGVYFTSGTQEGTPIDRLLGAIGRRFGVAQEVVAAPAGRGKAYFIERLLKEVLFAESGLAGTNRRIEVQKAAWQLGAYAAMALVGVFGVIALSVSYGRNRDYVAEVGAEVEKLREVAPVQSAASLETVVPRLDAVRAVVDSADRYRNDPPWSMRWGLYQGTSVGNAARDAYVRELDGALLPQVTARIQQRLVDYVPEPEKLYEYLKAYLMLGQPQYLDKAQLGFIADLEWRSAASDGGAALSRHFSSLLEFEDTLRPMSLDERLVAQARSTIRQASVPGLIYRQLRLSYTADTSRALRLDLAAGIGAERVLKRKSGASLALPVLSLYTAPVFKEIAARGTADLVKQFAGDQWVWGESGPSPTSSATLAADVMATYETDYIAVWDGLVKDIETVSMPSAASTKEALAILAGPTSPLRGFLRTVDEHTFLTQPADPAQPQTGIRGRLDDLFSRGGAEAARPTVAPGTRITEHFAPIHQLVTGNAGNAPIDSILKRLGEIQQELEPVGTSVGGVSPLDPSTVNRVGTLVNALKREAVALPPAIAAVVTEVADRSAAAIRSGLRGTLENRFRQDVLNQCTDITTGRYPFVTTSTTDVPLADFGRLFGYGGVFDSFFKNELDPLVDTSRSPWAWRPDASGVAVGSSRAMLAQFERALRIREMFFRQGSQEPELQFRVTPTELDVMALRFLLEVDGQSFENRHGPERSWQARWPGQSPGPAAATFEERSGSRPNIVAQGPWAWFRLMAEAQIQQETDVRYLLTFSRGGHQARVRVEAASIRNPYGKRDLEQFRCEA